MRVNVQEMGKQCLGAYPASVMARQPCISIRRWTCERKMAGDHRAHSRAAYDLDELLAP